MISDCKPLLAPSLLSADFYNMKPQIETIEKSGVKILHLDVMDGHFVPSISYGMPVIAAIRKCTDLIFDTHLMITDPDRYLADFANAGADIITVHIEACDDPAATLTTIKTLGKKAAIAINPPTDLSEILPYLPYCDMALVMSVNPGFGGQKYIDSVTSKIAALAEYRTQHGLCFDIEVDGGISPSNAGMVMDAGADILVAGSAVFKGDIASNIQAFNEVFNDKTCSK
ncbi:MAG: ribulose-phosphate 3-epimerase [Lachnospiraceae bacterium]|nr:ribulose-phosphate 3-epimerase [Candidatus Minthocola equi]